MINILNSKTMKRWLSAAALSIPILAVQATLPTTVKPFFGSVELGAAYAAEKEKKPKRKTKRTQAINQKVYKKLAGIQESIEAKDYSGALESLSKLQNGKRSLNDAEKATVLNLKAFIYYSSDDLAQALLAYKQIIGLEQAPDGTKLQARYSLAQMYFATEQYKLGVESLLAWLEVTEVKTSSAYVMLAQGYYQLKEYDDATLNVDKAIAMYKAKNKIPKEAWYSLQRFLYQEKKDYKKVVSILEELITHFPKKQHWSQLSGVYGELDQPVKQLAAYETLYVQDLLDKENELTRMAYIFLASEVPHKSAKVLEKAFKEKSVEETSRNLQLLGNSWRASRETKKAIPVMTAAAKKSDKGELWTRLGSLHLSNDSFKSAVEAINAGLKKGGVKRPDQANLALGMAYFNLKNYTSARKAFNKAKRDDRSEKTAKQWMKYMDKEIARQKSILEG